LFDITLTELQLPMEMGLPCGESQKIARGSLLYQANPSPFLEEEVSGFATGRGRPKL